MTMKRTGVLIAAALALAALPAVNGTVTAQKTAKIILTELSAKLAPAGTVGGGCPVGYGICGDSDEAYTSNSVTPGYPVDVVLQPSGALYMRIQQNRQVVFDFQAGSEVTRTLDGPSQAGMLTCREWAPPGYPPVYFFVPPPDLALPGVPPRVFTVITTGGSWRKNDAGAWEPNTATFNLLGMAPNASAFVSVSFRFDTYVGDDAFYIRPGHDWWEGTGGVAGAAKVTYSYDAATKRKTWVMVPVPEEEDAPPLLSPRDAASLFMPVDRDGKKHGAGTCYVGTWRMPFALTLQTR
jgi:hypothetical protein